MLPPLFFILIFLFLILLNRLDEEIEKGSEIYGAAVGPSAGEALGVELGCPNGESGVLRTTLKG